jgi:septal ring factor EnvC (AmiA/AmiB activator)
LGFSTKDLVSVLIVAAMTALMYFVAHNLTLGQERGFTGLAKLLETMNAHQNQTLDKLGTNQQALLELVHVNRAQMQDDLTRQNMLVNDQTLSLRRAVDEQTKALRRMLVTLNYNLSHEPADRIPLEFVPSEMPHPERAR